MASLLNRRSKKNWNIFNRKRNTKMNDTPLLVSKVCLYTASTITLIVNTSKSLNKDLHLDFACLSINTFIKMAYKINKILGRNKRKYFITTKIINYFHIKIQFILIVTFIGKSNKPWNKSWTNHMDSKTNSKSENWKNAKNHLLSIYIYKHRN